MLKRILGAVSVVGAIAGLVYDAASVPISMTLLASGVYLLKLDFDDRRLDSENKKLGIINEKNMPELTFHEKNIDTERQEFLQERYEKARNDFLALVDAKTKTRDKALYNQLAKMERIAGRFLTYLAENPEKISAAGKFIDYYQDRALLLTNRYFELVMTGLDTPEVRERREKVVKALFLMDEAYEAEFHRVLASDFMDIDAEIEVIEGNMKVEGITENNNSNVDADMVTSDSLPPKLNGTTSEKIAQKRRARGYKANEPIEYDRQDVVITKIIQSSLAILLGSFGAHKFYLGKNFQGFVYCLFFWTMIPGVIGFFEGLRYLVMRVDDYYLEYYSNFKRK